MEQISYCSVCVQVIFDCENCTARRPRLRLSFQPWTEEVVGIEKEEMLFKIHKNRNFLYRYGHHYMASIVYDKLSSAVSLERLQFFLTGLSQISMAECIISYGCDMKAIEEYYKKSAEDGAEAPKIDTNLSLAERLEQAVSYYWKALATIKVICFEASTFHF